MTDIKKVAITSVPSKKGEKKDGKRKRTIRLILTLPESNEKSCPEFNYGDLLSQHLYRRLGKNNLGDVINGPQREKGDPNADDEDEALQALARKFTQKYGAGVAGAPKGRKRKQENDFTKLGEGYDETDPFIDNSDAVDDVLPTNKETKHGGFYINFGELNFEEVQFSEDEDSNDSLVQNVNRKRKNEISSSSEDEEVDEETEDSVVRENGVLKKRKLDEGEILRRRKKMIDKFNAKKQKGKDETSENEADAKNTENEEDPKASNGTSIAASIEAVVSKARESADRPLSPIPPVNNVVAAMTTVEEEEEEEEQQQQEDLEQEHEEEEEEMEGVEETLEEEETGEKEEKEESSSSDSSSSSSSSDSSSSSSSSDDEKEGKESEVDECGRKEEEQEEEEEEEEVAAASASVQNEMDGEGESEGVPLNASDTEENSALPSDLPQDLIAALDRIKEVGKNSNASSQKFFTENVNKMLLSIEIKLCKYRGRKKNLIYSHLSQHLPCGTQTLIKRGKNLLAEKLEERLKMPVQNLKDALEKIMPPLIEAHALDCQTFAEKKGEGQVQPDEEAAAAAAAADSTKKQKLPKKKFKFTPELRTLLCEILKIRCQGWRLIKKRSETAEEHAKSFIDSHLKPLWPKGWVTTKMLYKETESAHSFVTSKNVEKSPTLGKKVTVLGGGTVSNASLLSPVAESSSSVSAATPKLAQDVHPKASCVDGEKASKTAASKPPPEIKAKSSPQPKSLLGPPEEAKSRKNIDVAVATGPKRPSEDKLSLPQGPKPLPSKVSSPKDHPKVPGEFQVSPVSESSPKSFHGFESPAKANYEILPRGDAGGARQSLVFDSVKKAAKAGGDPMPPVREGKPPKPSLTATALPKAASSSKAEGARSAEDHRKSVAGLMVRSVERINDSVPGTPSQGEEKEPGGQPREKRPPPAEGANAPPSSVGIIDLASDDESKPTTKPGAQRKIELGRGHNPAASEGKARNASNSRPGNEVHSKNNKLEQEMDQVMNELLQISKKNLKSHGPVDLGKKGVDVSRSLQAPHKSLVEEIPLALQSQQQQKRPNAHSSSQVRPLPAASLPYDLSKPAVQVVPTHRVSPFSPDVTDHKATNSTHSNHKKHISSSQLHKGVEVTSLAPNSHSNNPPYGSAHQAFGPNANSHSLPFGTNQSSSQSGSRMPPQPSKHTYQNSLISPRNPSNLDLSSSSSSPSLNSKPHSTPTPPNHKLGASSSPAGLNRTSSQNATYPSAPSGFSAAQRPTSSSHGSTTPSNHGSNHGLTAPGDSRKISPPTHSGSHKTSPSTPSDNRKQAPSTPLSGSYKDVSSINNGSRKQSSSTPVSGGNRDLSSSNSASRKQSPSTPLSGSNKDLSSSHSGSRRDSPSRHSGSSQRSTPSSHGASRKSSPSSHGRIPPSTHSNHLSGSSSASASASASSSHRSSSQSESQRSSSSSSRASSGQSGSRSQFLSVDLTSPQKRGDYGVPSSGGHSRSSKGGMIDLASGTSHGSGAAKATHQASSASSRPAKPSHNIEGLLYSSSSSSVNNKNSSPMNMSQPNFAQSQYSSHSQHSSHLSQQGHDQSSSSAPPSAHRSQSNSGSSWGQELSSSARGSGGPAKAPSRSSKSQNNSVTDNGSASLASLRLMEGLSVSNVPKKSSSAFIYSDSPNSGSSRALAPPSISHRPNASAQPKVKQRSDSYPHSPSQPLLGNLSAEQQQELWQQMNSGGYLSGMSPGDVYKYMQQHGTHRGTNSSGDSSSKKSNQF